MIPESIRKALLSKERRQAAIIKARKADATLQEIGDVMGLTRERVRQLESYGPKWKPRKKGKTGLQKKTVEQDKEIVKYYKKGIAVKEIADMLGVTFVIVKQRVEYLHRKGVIGYRIKVRKKRKRKK